MGDGHLPTPESFGATSHVTNSVIVRTHLAWLVKKREHAPITLIALSLSVVFYRGK
ncbi:hypothetical protein HDF14_005418 [Edaphobacter lichenicola]|jgi:hypothetical protein|uniref:Uncharacterized protein n=1 Tax=Tunturiibacter gelidiferens TaxID=3069689 RepID=A0A9X0QKD8_9BACT|nr:hypothetical protein [Edaphobacter lichenicola]